MCLWGLRHFVSNSRALFCKHCIVFFNKVAQLHTLQTVLLDQPLLTWGICQKSGGTLQTIKLSFDSNYQAVSISTTTATCTNHRCQFCNFPLYLIDSIVRSRSKLILVSMWNLLYRSYNAHTLVIINLFDK